MTCARFQESDLGPRLGLDTFYDSRSDEAHHAPAETWAAFLAHYPNAKFVFLTATPFRRDPKVIPGRMAYYYPVSKAAKESAFGRVTFTPAPVRNANDDEEIDRSVARTAIALPRGNFLKEDISPTNEMCSRLSVVRRAVGMGRQGRAPIKKHAPMSDYCAGFPDMICREMSQSHS